MRRFHFPLQTVLRVRELHEREAQRKLAMQSAEIAQLDRLNSQTREEIAAQQSDLRALQQRGSLDPSELTRRRAWIGHLGRTVSQREVLRAQMVAKRDQLQAEFVAARKATRTIEKLRERRWTEYATQRRKQEQALADELAQQLHPLRNAP